MKSIFELSKEIGIPVRTIRTMITKRQIPYYKLGHRTILFDTDKVMKAINRFEIKEVGRK